MNILPKPLTDVVEELGRLSGVGPRTAERYAYFLLRADPAYAQRLASAIAVLHQRIAYCPKTFALIEQGQGVSPLYADPARDRSLVAVVEESLDIVALEKTGQFTGTYHVLGGAISPIDGIGPEQLHIAPLLQRIVDDTVTEIILAMNASVEGESTALYLQRQIKQYPGVRITRLARGLPVGVDLEYADQITLKHALEGRREV